jgi:transposase
VLADLTSEAEEMQVVHERCAGLDVHKKTVVVCLLSGAGKQIRTYGTVTQQLLALADWLAAEQVTHVAMESTGVYWKPVYNLLENRGLEILVVNARHIKNVPGRKTDVKDAEWIADLLRHGLLRASFIPDRAQREARELVRYRRTVIEQRAHDVQRIQKVLEGANIKLSDVASDIMGASGRAMLQRLIEGEEDPVVLSQLAQKALRKKQCQLQEALAGTVGAHQRSMLRHLLDHVEFLEQQIAELDRQIEELMRPFEALVARLDAIWGLGRRTAEELLAEIGIDMSRWPTHRHFASWAKISPGNHESAGKRYSGRTGMGNRWLRAILVEAARNVSRNPRSYYAALYHRLSGRRGKKRAIVAVAHSLLVAIYHMLKEGTFHQDLGSDHFERLNREQIARRAVRRLERLGYQVTLQEAGTAA